ncbi:hypothetical protein NW754_009099 [Fusarium falciforme]|nr:hypothetical protein NW754_009099 [Fusarium falciforme]
MRLLNTQTIVVESFDDDKIPSYAILSHTWEAEEVTFQDMELGRATSKKGWAKVKDSCSMARKNGFDYVWLDTCCIDKTSSAELSEAINSMYHWYQEATVCYAFLADVSDLAGLPKSKWFTRGWTLQELIAPSSMIFLSQTWEELGTKATLDQVISERTRIPKAILSGDQDLEAASVAQRMSWAADRRTTRREDLAYCLMGIFSINMPLLYGEGERAFIRLQEEIMRVSDDHSLFAWKYPNGRGGLLAVSPAAFKDSGNIIPWNPFMPYNSPFTLTNKGVHLDLPFIGLGDRGTGLAVLSCTEVGDPDKLVAIYLRDSFLTMEHFERCKSEQFDLINLKKFRPAQYPTRSLCIRLRGRSQRPKGASDEKAQDDRSRLAGKQLTGGRFSQHMDMEHEEQKQLSLAIVQGREVDVKRLLALPNVHALADDDICAVLHDAVENGHSDIVRILLEATEDTEAVLQPFHLVVAAINRDLIMAKLLLENDADANSAWNGGLLFGFAAKQGCDEIVKAMLPEPCGQDWKTHLEKRIEGIGLGYKVGRHKSDMPEQQSQLRQAHHYTLCPLWCATVNGHEEMVQLLLEHGANPDSVVHSFGSSESSRTVLYDAARLNHEGVVRLLLSSGASPNLGGRDFSPLIQASLYSTSDNVVVARMLLESGADVEVMSYNYETP